MRRGSWTFNKSRERHRKSLTTSMTSSMPKQRARSNSVPAVLSLTQLPLFRHSWIPEIVVSGEKPEAEVAEVAEVVEGFSWTMAEGIIEGILQEMEASSRRPFHSLPLPPETGSRKGILKNASNDSLYRSYSGSLEEPASGSQSGINGNRSGSNHVPIPEAAPSEGLSWSHRSTSMPSLRAIDEDFRNSGECPQVSSGSSGCLVPFPSGFVFVTPQKFFTLLTNSSSGSLPAGSFTYFRFQGRFFIAELPLCAFTCLCACGFRPESGSMTFNKNSIQLFKKLK